MLRGESKQQKVLRAGAVILIAAGVSVLTAFLPMMASVGKVVYANIVPVILVSMEFGAIGGALYAIAASAVLNNIGMGSGVLLYVLLFQILEAVLIGLIWHGKKLHIARYVLTVLGGTFLLKPVSYILYYLFNREFLGGMGAWEYIGNSYRTFLQMGWKDTLLIYATGILIGYGIECILDKVFKGKKKKTT